MIIAGGAADGATAILLHIHPYITFETRTSVQIKRVFH